MQISIERDPRGISGLMIITPTIHTDDRGYFLETYNQAELTEAGFDVVFVQDNQSVSHKGALRGLHFQKQHPQGKLVRAIWGSFYDVAVDLRNGSPTFGRYFGIILSEINQKQLYIPEGFAHGFLALEDDTIFSAKITDYQHKGDGSGIAWDDPDIAIEWPLELLGECPLLISEADQKRQSLKEYIGRKDEWRQLVRN